MGFNQKRTMGLSRGTGGNDAQEDQGGWASRFRSEVESQCPFTLTKVIGQGLRTEELLLWAGTELAIFIKNPRLPCLINILLSSSLPFTFCVHLVPGFWHFLPPLSCLLLPVLLSLPLLDQAAASVPAFPSPAQLPPGSSQQPLRETPSHRCSDAPAAVSNEGPAAQPGHYAVQRVWVCPPVSHTSLHDPVGVPTASLT